MYNFLFFSHNNIEIILKLGNCNIYPFSKSDNQYLTHANQYLTHDNQKKPYFYNTKNLKKCKK